MLAGELAMDTAGLGVSQAAAAFARAGEALSGLTRLAALLGVVVGGGGCDGGGDGKGSGDGPPPESSPPSDDTGVDSAPTADDTTATDADVDEDGDGYPRSEDCNDDDPEVHPGAPDPCNRHDDDCNGVTNDPEPGEASECIEKALTWFVQEASGWHQDGSAIAVSGDLDRDGAPDLLLGGPAEGDGVLHIFLNAEMWEGDVPTSAARWTLHGEYGDWLAWSAILAGRSADFYPDMDGDGSDEVLVGATQWEGSPGQVYLVTAAALEYEYGDLDVREVSTVTLGDESGETEGNGAGVVTLGDVDGDGLADIYVQARYDGWVVPGAVIGGEAPSLEQGIMVTAPDGYADEYSFGDSVTRAGDLDGDGIADLVLPCIHCERYGAAYVFSGASLPTGGSVSVAAADIIVSGMSDQNLAMDIAAGEDIDGDGLTDWAMCSYMLGEVGGAWVFLDAPSHLGSLSTEDADTHVYAFDASSVGASVVLGDFDGDTLGDLALEDSYPDVTYYPKLCRTVVLSTSGNTGCTLESEL